MPAVLARDFFQQWQVECGLVVQNNSFWRSWKHLSGDPLMPNWMPLAFFGPSCRSLFLRRSHLPSNLSDRSQCQRSSPFVTIPVRCGAERTHRVLVLGGTGRVGEAAASSLAALAQVPLEVCIAGRDGGRGVRILAKLQEQHKSKRNISFSSAVVDINNLTQLGTLVSKFDTVLHTAGPFQQRSKPAEVLSQVIASGCKRYIDVCDDLSHAEISKTYTEDAKEHGVSCWICTGIYPGLSNLMASVLIRSKATSKEGCKPVSVRFSYYTAGTGGIGATVLASTFLILSEDVTVFDENGDKIFLPSASLVETIDFRGKTGKKQVYLLNLPETVSIRNTICEGEVLAKFCTDPPMWNWLLQLTARLVPRDILRDRRLMQAFSSFSLPVVRFVDLISGARTAIRVDVRFDDGSDGLAIYEHQTLRECVGTAVASFALEMITSPSSDNRGVFYPEELAVKKADAILTRASKTADAYSMTIS